jgi:nucleoside-diphosphate-sugar epimerase
MIQIKNKYKKFLVTGGAGFVGSHICEELLLQGKKVICIDNFGADFSAGKFSNIQNFFYNPDFVLVEEDVVDYDKIRSYFDDVDIVLHQAASKCTVCRIDPLKDLMVNARGSWCVFECSRQAGVKKVIHAATGSIMDGKPKSFYGVSKQAGESYLRAFQDYYPDFKYTSLRYHHVYGPKQENSDVGGVIPIFIRHVYRDEPTEIFGDGLQVRHFTTVKDVVASNFFCVNDERTDNKVYNVMSSVKISILDLAKLIHKLMGKTENIIHGPAKPGDIKSFLTTGKELENLGFDYDNDFEKGLKETIDWYEHNIL